MTLRQQIQARIADNAGAFSAAGLVPFREVAGAADLANILAGRVSAPGCYIYRHQVRADANQLDDGVLQRVGEVYGVVIVVRNVRDARHGDSSDLSEAYGDVVRGLLLGWQPTASVDDFEYRGGRLVRLQYGYHYWQDDWSTARIIRNQ